MGGGGVDNWLTFGSALGMDAMPFDTLRQSAKPVVAAVNGCVRAAACRSLCADMAVVSERATFRVPGLYRGIADTYYSQMLARLIGPVRTRDLMFTGRTPDRRGGAGLGHGRPVVPHDELLDAAREVLAQCCRTAPGARSVVKASIDNYLGLYDRIGMQRSLGSPESIEGFMAFRIGAPGWVHPDLRIDGRLWVRRTVGRMASDQMKNGRLWVPLIIGLILGAAVATSTGHRWWSTVGVLIGAAAGGVIELVRRRAQRLITPAGMSRSISASQILADMSDGARQSPRGERTAVRHLRAVGQRGSLELAERSRTVGRTPAASAGSL